LERVHEDLKAYAHTEKLRKRIRHKTDPEKKGIRRQNRVATTQKLKNEDPEAYARKVQKEKDKKARQRARDPKPNAQTTSHHVLHSQFITNRYEANVDGSTQAAQPHFMESSSYGPLYRGYHPAQSLNEVLRDSELDQRLPFGSPSTPAITLEAAKPEQRFSFSSPSKSVLPHEQSCDSLLTIALEPPHQKVPRFIPPVPCGPPP
jgi:hypothetical protein